MPGDSTPRPAAALICDLAELTISSQRTGDTHTITLAGELDLMGAGPLAAELQRVEATDARVIVLDLSALTFMDSSGLRVLVLAHKRSQAGLGRLVITRPNGAALRIVEVAGLLDTLPFQQLGTGESSR